MRFVQATRFRTKMCRHWHDFDEWQKNAGNARFYDDSDLVAEVRYNRYP